jgi:23S rRNA (cytosine1962-C5)-methyltransferase
MQSSPSSRGRRPLSPSASGAMASVTIQRATLHPNIFRKRILSIEGNPGAGDWVSVYRVEPEPRRGADNDEAIQGDDAPSSSERKEAPSIFGYGIYNPKAEVAVRLYSWNARLPEDSYWDQLLDDAVALRHKTLKLSEFTDAYRVLHGEADGFPGLVVDRYADTLSAEAFSLGMYQRAGEVLDKLQQRLGTRFQRIAPSPQFLSQEGVFVDEVVSEQAPEMTTVMENGVKYRVHFGTGHKTGFFCDQRDNRQTLASHAKSCSVLDLCCYTGGFAVAAAKAGSASEVIGVDLDEEALAMAKKNADINQTRVRFVHADAFSYMRDMIRNGRQFDIVVLDPPKLIRSRMEMEEGSHKHFDLNRLALQLVRRGGLFLTCSCAGLLSAEAFQQIVQSAARSGGFDETGKRIPGRTVQVFESRVAAPDHPVALHCPETGYLKALWARVL